MTDLYVQKAQFCISVGFSLLNFLLSFYKDNILVHGAIPKALRLEYQVY